jgi:hypothetical protein
MFWNYRDEEPTMSPAGLLFYGLLVLFSKFMK